MKKFLSGTIGSVLFLTIVGFAAYFVNLEYRSYLGRQAVANTGLELHSLNEALAKAKREDKLVFVDVSAIWCGTCRRLDNEVFSNEEVRAVLKKRFVFSRLEYEEDEGQKFVRERNVQGFPNLWVLDSDGNDIKRLEVVFDPSKFAEQLRGL